MTDLIIFFIDKKLFKLDDKMYKISVKNNELFLSAW